LILTARDHAHKRIIEYYKSNKNLPKPLNNLKNHAIYHCGPIIKQIKNETSNKYVIFSGGPTTSSRMTPFQEEVCRILDIHIIIGKGGMKKIDFSSIKSIYLAFTGGCGAIFRSFVSKIHGVIWEDLGMPEAIWLLHVKDFGPLIVGHDSKGNSLYKNK